MAARVFGEEDPIGRRVTLAENAGIGSATIVGVVGDVRHGGLESAPEPEVYIHYLQNPPTGPLIVMRTSGEPAGLAPAVRGAVHDVDAAVTISDVRTMSDLRSQAMTERRFVTALAVLFGVIALTLAVLGVYGVMALAVSERTREIGIRLALGAPRGTVLALVVRNGLGLGVTGIAIGIAAALAAGPTLASQLYGITPHDPVTLVGVPVLLLGAAVAASVIPARRAMTVDPTIALRSG